MKKFLLSLIALAGLSLSSFASDSGCFLTLTVYPSPYANSSSNMFSCATCDGTMAIGHTPTNTGDGPDAQGNYDLVISDGDFVDVSWPNCCTTGWAIVAEGAVITVDHGVVSPSSRVTLSVPNSFGTYPYPTVSGTNQVTNYPGQPPQAPMLPPFSSLSLPPAGNYQPINNVGYFGGRWQIHITCVCDAPPGQVKCIVTVTQVALYSGPNPSWVMNQGAPVLNVVYDLYPAGMPGHAPYWCGGGNLPPILTTNNNGFIYQWSLH